MPCAVSVVAHVRELAELYETGNTDFQLVDDPEITYIS
jgi:hypothetical protein